MYMYVCIPFLKNELPLITELQFIPCVLALHAVQYYMYMKGHLQCKYKQ